MKPDVWGKHMWYTIHFIAMDYPEQPTSEDKRNFQVFFENLHTVIPCYKCSVNYIKHLHELPINSEALKSNEGLFKWTVDLHNIVNRDLGKQVWSYEKARAHYIEFKEINENSCKLNTIVNWTLAILVLILIIILLAVLHFYNYTLPLKLISKAYRT